MIPSPSHNSRLSAVIFVQQSPWAADSFVWRTDGCDFLRLLITSRSFKTLAYFLATCSLYLLAKQIRHVTISFQRKEHENLIFVSVLILFIFLHCPVIPSLSPSLPRCRLNLRLFIACSSSRAGLWVSMLGGRRGCCCCWCITTYTASCLEEREEN